MTTQPTMTDEDRANLVAYLDGELDEKTALALEAKLSLDSRARAEADQLKRTWEILDYLPRPAPSPNFTHRTMERLTAHRPTLRPSWRLAGRWRPFALGIGWAAAALVASAVGFAGGRLLPRPTPPTGGDTPPDIDHELLVKDLRVIENRRLYEHADTIEFVRELANPDDPILFGDDNYGS